MEEVRVDSFVFYASFYDAIRGMDDATRLQIYDAICEYGIYRNTTELTGIAYSILTMVMPLLDANYQRRVNGGKGGRPKKENKTSGYQNKKPVVSEIKTSGYQKTKPNVNVNESGNAYETDSVNNNEGGKCSSSNVNGDHQATTTTNFLDIEFVAKKILSLQRWNPDTSKFIAEKFINLNSENASKGWGNGVWESRLNGFLRDERTPEDYDSWQMYVEESKHIMSREELNHCMQSWLRANSRESKESVDNAKEIWRAYNEKYHQDKNWEDLPGDASSTCDENKIPCIVTQNGDTYYPNGAVIKSNNNDDLPFS